MSVIVCKRYQIRICFISIKRCHHPIRTYNTHICCLHYQFHYEIQTLNDKENVQKHGKCVSNMNLQDSFLFFLFLPNMADTSAITNLPICLPIFIPRIAFFMLNYFLLLLLRLLQLHHRSFFLSSL